MLKGLAIALAAILAVFIWSPWSAEEPSGESNRSESAATAPKEETDGDNGGEAAQSSHFARANWDLTAEPGALRQHQRIDPMTGKPVVLSEAQRSVSDETPLTELERVDADVASRQARDQVTYGDKDEKGEAGERPIK